MPPATPLAPGTELTTLTKELAFEKFVAFSRYFREAAQGESVHCSREAARRKGFARPIAQGLMSYGYINELIARHFGNELFTRSRVNVKFIKPSFEGDRLTIGGVVERLEATADGQRVVLDVWCKNQHGDLLTVGKAEVTLH